MEQSLSSLTYKGSIPEAIAEAKKQKKLFVVYISGQDAESTRLESSTWTDPNVADSVAKYCILLHIPEGSNDAAQFSAIYPQKSIPCITAIGYNGVQLCQIEGFVSAEVLTSSLEKLWLGLHIQVGGLSAQFLTILLEQKFYDETTAAVLSAALASKKSESTSSAVSNIASSHEGTSSSEVAPSPMMTGNYGNSPDAIGDLKSGNNDSHETSEVSAEEKSNELGGVICSKPFDANGSEAAILEKSKSSTETNKGLEIPAAVEPENAGAGQASSLAEDDGHAPQKVTDNSSVVSKEESQSLNTDTSKAHQVVETEVANHKNSDGVNICAKVRKSNDVHLNIRIPNSVNLQEKFSLTCTLGMVKDYVDNHASYVGTYDLAVPYPRKIFSGQDLSKSLSELGLFDRQALILVPREKATNRTNAMYTVGSSNESNGGYFAFVRRILSFVNPLSYLGGGSSSTRAEQQSQNSMWEYGPNPSLQNNMIQTDGPSSSSNRVNSATDRNDGQTRQSTTSRFAGNVHFLRHDEDDSRSKDRNSFWNGNSTQYGGSDDGK